MPGQAIVTINENEWSVSVANTTSELIAGLSGVVSLAAGTGMLFVLPVTQVVTVDTTQMLFPIDIIFIKDNAVLSIASNIQPGYLVEEATSIDMFLEVNADEADLVEVGDIVSTATIQEPGFDWSSIMSFAIPLVVLGFVSGMISGMLKPASGSSSSSSVRRLGKPRDEEERVKTHEKFYGTKELPPRGTGLGERGESLEGRGLGEPKTEAGRKETHYAKYGTEELPARGSGQEGYYWEITDVETGEIMQRGKPYTTGPKALAGARSYQKGRSGKDKENLVVIRIYDNPNMEEWGKTIKYVMESGMHRGIPILIGKTPLQEAALDRLWPYSILEIHSDGDLTVSSAGRKYVVTTEGGVFEEKQPLSGSGYSIHGEPRSRLVEQYGSWAVGRAEAICPEDDIPCVTREAKRLIDTLRSRYGETAMAYVRITNPGKSVFYVGDTVSLVAFEKENKRLRSINEAEATGEVVTKSIKPYSIQPGPVFEDTEVVNVVDMESRDRFIWQIAPDKISAFCFYHSYDAGMSLAGAVAWRIKDIQEVSFRYYNNKVEVSPFYLGDEAIKMYWGDRKAGFISNLTDIDKKLFEAGFFTTLRKFLREK